MIYVASPYSNNPEDYYAGLLSVWPTLRETLDALSRAHPLYDLPAVSPILHYNNVARWHRQEISAAAWRRENIRLLKHANALLVAKLPGWDKSVGVSFEIGWAYGNGLPIFYYSPATASITMSDDEPTDG